MSGIYDAIGGAPAVSAAVDDFYVRIVADPSLAPYFDTTDMRRLKAHQRAFFAAALGGPQLYAGRDMAAAHAQMSISRRGFRCGGRPSRRDAGKLAGARRDHRADRQSAVTASGSDRDTRRCRRRPGLVAQPTA